MKNKFCGHKSIIKKGIVYLLLSSFFFCSNAFAREFNAIIENDTDKILVISDVIKKYSGFDEDFQIEKNLQELKPKQRTIVFSVNICGDLCLRRIKNGDNTLDGFYFTTEDGKHEIGAVWGEIQNTGLTPTFGPLSKESTDEIFKTEISIEGIPQDSIYVFKIQNAKK